MFNYTAATGIALQHQHKGTPNCFFFLHSEQNPFPIYRVKLHQNKWRDLKKKVTKSNQWQDSDQRYQRADSLHHYSNENQEQKARAESVIHRRVLKHQTSVLPCGWGRYRGRLRSPAWLWQSVCVCLLSNDCLHSCLFSARVQLPAAPPCVI